MSTLLRIVSPSDLSYMYDRCPRCYWLKLRGVVNSGPALPAVFRDIDAAQKSAITIAHVRALGVPAVEFLRGEKVASVAEERNGAAIQVRGFTDKRVRLEDGSVGVLDFKTSKPKSENTTRFWRAMSAYQYAIEHGEAPEEVTLLGLIVFSPQLFKFREDKPELAYFAGQLTYMPVEIDRARFSILLDKLCETVSRETMPEPGDSCDMCRHASDVADRIVADRITRAIARGIITEEAASMLRTL